MNNKDNLTWQQEAAQLEASGNTKAAAKLYRAVLKRQHRDEKTYDRLMVLFRKMKDYRNESLIIQRAIGAFEDFYHQHAVKMGKKVIESSKRLMLALGLVDKQGQPVHQLQPVQRWSKRLEQVNKKLGQSF